MTTRFPNGDPYWHDIVAGALATYKFMLLDDTWVPDPTTETVVVNISGNELTDGSYARETMSGAAISVDISTLLTQFTKFTCSDPTFGALVGGENIGQIVLYADLVSDPGNDITSVLMMAWPFAWTTDGSAVTPQVNANGLHRLRNS